MWTAGTAIKEDGGASTRQRDVDKRSRAPLGVTGISVKLRNNRADQTQQSWFDLLPESPTFQPRHDIRNSCFASH